MPNLSALRQRALEVSAAPSVVLTQRDTFYAVRQGRLKLREFGDGAAELIYYERPDHAGPKLSQYTRTPVPDAASMRALLGQILETKAVIAKRREVFLVGRTRIHLDEVEDLGSFMELEVVLAEGETVSDGERIASALMEQLGVLPKNLVSRAYVDLLETAKPLPTK